jgi:hypothetical protein
MGSIGLMFDRVFSLTLIQDEYTVLMYLTPEWKAEYYGETAFFEEVMQPNGKPYEIGQQKYNWLASVRPRYGRMVIFRGIIPHSARPPSPGFTGARYTFACKVCECVHSLTSMLWLQQEFKLIHRY